MTYIKVRLEAHGGKRLPQEQAVLALIRLRLFQYCSTGIRALPSQIGKQGVDVQVVVADDSGEIGA